MQPAESNPYNYVGANPTNQTDPTGAVGVGEIMLYGFGLIAFGATVVAALGVAVPVATTVGIVFGAATVIIGTACLFEDENC